MGINSLSEVVLLLVGSSLLVACSDLPPLPGLGDGQAPDGSSSPNRSLDGGSRPLDQGPASGAMDAWDAPAMDAWSAPAADAAATSAVDTSRISPVDASDTPAWDGPRAPIIDAPEADVPKVLVCPTGYMDCNGDNVDCETAITTPEHCGGCKTACGVVANGVAACTNGKCTVKCTAPFQDCDGKYDNGCEIPVGRGNACDRDGLAAFSGDKPPCGTPYCGSATTSSAVANFGSWYCSFCEHCYMFGNGGSWCLFSGDTGNFSGSRCSDCCAADDQQVCPR